MNYGRYSSTDFDCHRVNVCVCVSVYMYVCSSVYTISVQ